MARRRDYKAEYARRQAKARSLGYRGYAERRRAHERLNDSFIAEYYDEFIDDDNREEVAKAVYMMAKEGPTEYGLDSWHKYLFVDVLEYMTLEKWLEHYPNGERDYGIR